MSDPDTIGKTFRLSLMLENGNVLVVEFESTDKGIVITLHQEIGGKRTSIQTDPFKDSKVAMAALASLAADRLRHMEAETTEVGKFVEEIRQSFESCLKLEGLLEEEPLGADLRNWQECAETFQGWRVNVKAIFNEELPQRLGGYDFTKVSTWHNANLLRHEWIVLWGSPDDGIEMVVTMADGIIIGPTEPVSSKLREQILEKLEKLREENPGDFEVECLDDTGMEEHFDTGLTYMAEAHTDKDLLWVYDRYGQRGEFGNFRFRRVP